MRHVWGFLSALGLLVFVIFGTWACLTSSTSDPTTSKSTLIALIGAAVVVIGLVARGDGSPALAKARRAIGGLGLVVTPVAGFLTLLALATDASAAPAFLLVTLVAMMAWAQAIAAQVGLSFRVSFMWLAALALSAATIVVVGGVIVAVLVAGFGWETRAGTRLAFILVLGLSATVLIAWARGRPDRGAVTRAAGRAALGRSGPGDVELLKAGPGSIIRRRAASTPDGLLAEVDPLLAATTAEHQSRDDDPADQARPGTTVG